MDSTARTDADKSPSAEGSLDIERKRRPRVETSVTLRPAYMPDWRPSGVELVMDRKGIWVGGWYDSMIVIQSFGMTWEEFDREREALK